MTAKVNQGCATPRDEENRAIYRQLVEAYAPVLYFDPSERFFPVDLGSTVQASTLYRVDSNKAPFLAVSIAPQGTIRPPTLAGADPQHFITVAGWDEVTKMLATQPPEPYTMPKPRIDEIYRRYVDREIHASLTIYGSVCTAREASNYILLETFPPVDGEVKNALAEGILINYYFHFPAMEASLIEMEGDWSGISLLFRRLPDLNNLAGEPPLLVCYFKKTDYHMVAGNDGFRKWQQVSKLRDQKTGIETHPRVYVSRGLHNCYFEPLSTSIDLDPPWNLSAAVERIEGGTYKPGPSTNTLVGGDGIMDIPWWADIIFPPLFFLKQCASGCQYPVRFDSSGIPADGKVPTNDEVQDGGNATAPQGADTGHPPGSSEYPTQTSPVPLLLNVVYIDLYNADMADWWGFAGAWGAARLSEGWGMFLGRERPNVAAWFLWNLYWNPAFGSGGKGSSQLGP